MGGEPIRPAAVETRIEDGIAIDVPAASPGMGIAPGLRLTAVEGSGQSSRLGKFVRDGWDPLANLALSPSRPVERGGWVNRDWPTERRWMQSGWSPVPLTSPLASVITVRRSDEAD